MFERVIMSLDKKTFVSLLLMVLILESIYFYGTPALSTAAEKQNSKDLKIPVSEDSIYIIRTKESVSNYLLALREVGEIRYIYHSFRAVSMYIPKDRINKLTKFDFIESISPNFKVKALEIDSEHVKTNDVHIALKDAVKLTKVDVVWNNYNLRGRGVTIAVLDTGIDSRHYALDDLDDNASTDDPKVILHVSMVPNESISVIAPYYDTNGHGTHVAGIVAGTGAPDYEYIGVAPAAKLIDIKVLAAGGKGETEWVLAGLQWCIDHKEEYNITVVNISLGADENTDGTDILSLAVDELVKHGIVVVVAAGNSGPKLGTVGTPASSRLAITVGATLKTDPIITSYSSKGPTLDGRIKPDVVAPGGGILSGDGIYAPMCGTKDYYVEKRGTSMAAPHVSGIVALLLEANPNLTPMQVKYILTSTAIKCEYTDAKYRPNNEEGYGLVQADAAVEAALNISSLPQLDVDVTPTRDLYYYQWNVTLIVDSHGVPDVQFYMVFYNETGFPIFSKVGVTNESGLAEVTINSTELAVNLTITGNATVTFTFLAYKLGYEWTSFNSSFVTVDYIPEEAPPSFMFPLSPEYIAIIGIVVVVVIVLFIIKGRKTKAPIAS